MYTFKGENMNWDVIKARIANLFEFVTSKKVLMAIAAIILLLYVASVPKIIAIGVVVVSYIIAQGYVDGQKEKVKDKSEL